MYISHLPNSTTQRPELHSTNVLHNDTPQRIVQNAHQQNLRKHPGI